MKPKNWHLVPAVAAGILVGLSLPTPGTSGAGETAPASDAADVKLDWKVSDRRTHGPRSASFSARSMELREELRHATPDRIPQLLHLALQEADQAQRMALLLEIFSAVNESNVAEALDAFEMTIREVGGDYPQEWALATYLAGQRAGEAMMETWLGRGLGEHYRDAHETFWGWCTVDPRSAEAWLDGIAEKHPSERERLMRAVIGGLAIHDPDLAIERMRQLEEPVRSNCIGDLGHHLVQGEGLDRGIEWMLEVNRSAKPGDEEYAARVTDWMFMKISRAGAHGKGGAETARRLEKVHMTLPIDERRLIHAIESMPATEALELVEHLAHGPVLDDPERRDTMIGFAFSRAMTTHPANASEWLAAHPGSAFAEMGEGQRE